MTAEKLHKASESKILARWEPWQSNHLPLWMQFEAHLGEGYLCQEATQNPNLLRSALTQITALWKGAKLVQDLMDFDERISEGETRNDNKTPTHAHHKRTAIRTAMRMQETQDSINDLACAIQIGIALTHDVPEDHGTTKEEFTGFLHLERGHPYEVAEDIFFGASALSNKNPDGTKMSEYEYNEKIEEANRQRPDLHLWDIKGSDCNDNVITDFARFRRERSPQALKQLRRFRPKAEGKMPYLRKNGSYMAPQLEDAITLSRFIAPNE